MSRNGDDRITSLVLHGYWRSSASYRVRIALNLKGLEYRQVTHDLRSGAQHDPAYRMLAPQALVPALETEQGVLSQSLAILEWVDETHPTPALLPPDALGRALVRSMAAVIACDIHPLNNLRVLKMLREQLHMSDAAVQAWIGRWIGEGFAALDTLVADHGGRYCYGETPTIADCCLVPQIYNARRFGIDLTAFPALVAVDAHCATLDAFSQASPDRQPDADGTAA